MGVKTTKASPAERAGRAARIRALEDRRRRSSRRECEIIARIGRRLTEAKARIPGFEKWVRRELPFTVRTARRYMAVAEKRKTLSDFFPLGKSVVYELLELPEEKLAALTPASRLRAGGRSLALDQMNCRELHQAVSEILKKPKRAPSPETRGMGALAELAQLQRDEPEAWEALADDVAALLSKPCPPCPPTDATLDGATRDERAAEVGRHLGGVRALLPQVYDVAGPLSQTVKQELMASTNAFWREANALVAFADGSASATSLMR